MSQISQILVDGKSYILPSLTNQHFKSLAVLKTPNKGDWYIYYSIWDFIEGKWKPVKFYTKQLNNAAALQLPLKKRTAIGEAILSACNEDLSNGIDPKTAKAIAPFSKVTLKDVLEDAADESKVPRLDDAIEIFLATKTDTLGGKTGAENKENTAVTYKYFFKAFKDYCIRSKIDNFKVNKYTKQHVFDFMQEYLNAGIWGASTYNSNLGFIKSFFNFFAKRYDFTHYIGNIEDVEVTEETDKFEPFNELDVKRVFDFLSAEQVIEYPHYTRTLPPNDLIRIIAKTIFYSFLRPSEIRRIKVKHIKRYKQGYFDLSADITKNKKVASRFKELYIDPILVEEYSKLGWDELITKKECQEYYVFTKDLIPSLDKSSNYQFGKKFSRELDKLDKRASEGDTIFADAKYSLYSLKHSGNIQAYKAGWSIAQLQLQNRHSSEEQTENYLRELKQEINQQPRPPRAAI